MGGAPSSLLRAGLALCALLAAGCASSFRHTDTPAALTDSITRAVYANDYEGTTAPFDPQTKAEVTRTEIGRLSDRMHALGSYQGLTQTKADADRGLYEFDLRFASGHMTAKLRVDPSGKVGAYRVVPNSPGAGAPPTSPPAG
jgi:hypothetical protein